MCFRISHKNDPWDETVAYKLVSEYPYGDLRSYFYSRHIWAPGKEHRIPDNAPILYAGKAYQGIYVYRSREVALKVQPVYFSPTVCISVRVDPKDFLFQNEEGTTATYRAATMIEVLA